MKTLSTAQLVEECIFATEHEELAAHGIWRIGYTVVRKSVERVASDRDKRFGHLHLVVAGEARVRVNDGWQAVVPGMAYICPPGADWAWQYDEQSSPWTVLFVRLLKGRGAPVSYSQPASHTVSGISPDDLLWVFQGLARESRQQARPLILSLMAELVMHHVREAISGNTPDRVLASLWNEVVCNLDHKWTIEEMTARTGLHTEALRRKCLEETGLSPGKHVTRLRMRHACHLLTDKRMSLDEVAASVGYESQFSFSKAFLAHTGMRPSAYRKQNPV